jgi:hypothetical protein
MKKRVFSILLLVFCVFFTACEFSTTEQKEKMFQAYYEKWKDFVFKSLEEDIKKYNIVQSSNDNLFYDSDFYTDFYDKAGDKKISNEHISFSIHAWYMLEANDNGAISFAFKSVKGIRFGLVNSYNGSSSPVYFTNRIVNTNQFGVEGFNLSATNGGELHDYNYSDELENEIKGISFPIIVGVTKFVATKILSRNIKINEEYNQEYIEFEILRVVVEFSNDFERAVVKIYNFNKGYGSIDTDKIALLDDIYYAY